MVLGVFGALIRSTDAEDGESSHFDVVVVDRGESDVAEAREIAVVISDDADVVRYRQTHLLCLRHGDDGGVVVVGEDRRWPHLRLKQSSRCSPITIFASPRACRCATTNPINTKRPGAHRDRPAAAPVNHNRQPARPPGIAVGGTAIPTGTSLPQVLPRAGLINGHDSPHSPTQRNTLIPPTHRDHIVRAGLLGLLDTANRTGPRKSPRSLSPAPRCDKSVTTRPAAVMTGRRAPCVGKPCSTACVGV